MQTEKQLKTRLRQLEGILAWTHEHDNKAIIKIYDEAIEIKKKLLTMENKT